MLRAQRPAEFPHLCQWARHDKQDRLFVFLSQWLDTVILLLGSGNDQQQIMSEHKRRLMLLQFGFQPLSCSSPDFLCPSFLYRADPGIQVRKFIINVTNPR